MRVKGRDVLDQSKVKGLLYAFNKKPGGVNLTPGHKVYGNQDGITQVKHLRFLLSDRKIFTTNPCEGVTDVQKHFKFNSHYY